jgi:hypothetical protein
MIRKTVFLSLSCLLVASIAFPQAQSYGRLEGVVRDSQGLVLPGVTVTLSGENVMGTRMATTDVDGSYRFLALPPGTYNLLFELAGFQGLNREGVVVSTGSTFTIDASLQIATVAETITVTGESPVVDVKTTGISATFDQTQLYDVPSATDMWAVLGQTPGIRMTGYDVGGSHKSQQTGYESFGLRSQVRVINDGINTTEGTGGAGGYYDFYAIDEFQVSAQGADVEMSTPGAQVVATTKSGGNEFSGLYHIDYTPESFVTDNIDSDLEARGGTSAPVLLFWEGHADLGGPIIKDKLWFFGAYNHFKIDRVISGQPQDVATDIGIFDMYSGKLNWQITEKDQFIGYSQWTLKEKPYRGLSLTIPADSIRAQESWAWLHKAEWQRVWNDRVFTNVFVGHFGFGWPMVPAVDPNERPARIDIATQHQRGAGWQPFTWYRYKPQSTGQVAWYVPDKAGSHDFKFGWDWQIDSNQFGWNTNSGALRYRDNSNLGPPPAGASPDQLGAVDQIDFFNVPTINDDRNMHTDIFAQDVWTLNDRVTLSLGVRFGRQSLYYLAAQQTPELGEFFSPIDSPAADLKSYNNLAPRLGVTIDATGKGKTVVKGYYGRYYGNIGTGIQASNPAGQQQLRYDFLDPNGNGLYDGQQELGDLITCIGVCGEGGAGLPIEFDLMYADEYSFSVEHELAADTSVRFSYVRKQTRNNWGASSMNTTAAQINTSRTIENMTQAVDVPCTGCPGEFAGTTLNLRTLPEGAPDNDIRFTNAPGDTDGNYDTIQFAFKRRFRGNFFLNANFDYQWRSEMRVPEYEATSPLSTDPLTQLWYPEYNRNISVNQDSTTYNAHFSARYVLPYEVGLAGTYRFQSGFPWAPIHVVTLPQVGPVNVFLEDIENNRSDSVGIVDVRLDKAFSFGEKYTVTGFFDVYNLMNVNPETNFVLRTGGSFNNIIEWIQGRTLKVGARFQF